MSILRNKKVIITAIIPLALIITLAFASYAATPVSSTNLNGLAGITYNVAPYGQGFTFSNPKYTVTLSDAAASGTLASPAAWANNGEIHSTLVAGQWQLQVTLTADKTETSATTHTAIMQADFGLGQGYVTIGTIYFTSTATTDNSMTLTFATGYTSLEDASAIVITLT